jgi:NTP pyrophosphatase (non-canonical NTP hydrolase)
MTRQVNVVLDDIANEVVAATNKFPTWPDDPFHALAVIGEEFGELSKAIVQYTYEPEKRVTIGDVREEAVQLAAMAVRFLISLDSEEYYFHDCSRHEQR